MTDKIGSFYLPENLADKTRDIAEEVEIVQMGEDAFTDLSPANRPKPGDKVVVARYEGKVLGKTVDEVIKGVSDKDHELRIIQDTRVLCKVTEEE